MFLKTSILLVILNHFFILTMASSNPAEPSKTWTHVGNVVEKKDEFAEEPMEHPAGEKYTIVTGGAQGADEYAERLALAYECRLDIKIGPNHPRAKCLSPIQPTEADLYHARESIKRANQTLQRKSPIGTATYFEELMVRNYFIARQSYALYAFGYLDANKTTVQGGTGWTVQLALDMGKRVYLFDLTDNQWYEFIYYHLQKGSYVKKCQFQLLKSACSLTLYDHVGIVGSRHFTEQGKKEMRALFRRTFLR